MKYKNSIFVSAIALLSTSPAFAQNDAHQLEETIVTASQHGKTEAEIAGSINILSGEELQREAASTLGETLKNQIGVQSSSFGPGVGIPVIRGQSGKRVEVLQNNMVIADVSDTSADHAVATEAFLADRIEILRGPATLRYGSGAIGGVVNVIDNRIHTSFEEGTNGGIHFGYDDNNEGTVAVAKLDAGKNGWMFHIDGVLRDNENTEIPGFADHEADDPDETTNGFIENTDADSESFSIGISHIGENFVAGFSINEISNNYGIPPGGHGHEEEALEEEEEEEEEFVRIDLDQTAYQGKLIFSNLDGLIDHVDVDLSYSDYEHQEIEIEGGVAAVGTLFDSEVLEIRAEAAHRVMKNWLGTFGLQYSDRDFNAEGEEAFVPPSSTDRFGIYLIEETTLGAGTVELGLRFDDQSISSEIAGDIDHTSFNSSLSYLLPISDNQRFSLILNRSERAPISEELLSEGEHIATNTYEIGDPDLDLEESVGIELTWALDSADSGLSARASLFHTDFSNYIYEMDTELRFSHDLEEDDGLTGLAACSDDIADFENDPEEFADSVECFLYVEEGATFTGVEAEIQFAVNEQNSIRFWGDYVRAELDDNGDVPRIPPARIGASWDYRQDNWNGGLSVTNAFDQNNPGEGQEETDGYVRVDAHIGWNAEDYSIFLQATNLTDDEIRNSTSFLREISPEPGRSIAFGATYRF